MDDQLSFVVAPRVELTFHPDGRGFAANISGHSGPVAWGATEALAIGALADHIRALLRDAPPANGLTAFGQVLVAADRLGPDEFHAWLSERSEVPVLHESSAD